MALAAAAAAAAATPKSLSEHPPPPPPHVLHLFGEPLGGDDGSRRARKARHFARTDVDPRRLIHHSHDLGQIDSVDALVNDADGVGERGGVDAAVQLLDEPPAARCANASWR